MRPRTLNLGELNRTLLARQLLLARSDLDAAAVIERLVGLQTQLARPPYIGLWTRLAHFTRADLASLIERRSVVKATFLRATLHLLTAADYATFRATLQPVLTSALDAIVKQRAATIDVPGVVEAARALLDGQPRSFAEITGHLTARAPDVDPGGQ